MQKIFDRKSYNKYLEQKVDYDNQKVHYCTQLPVEVTKVYHQGSQKIIEYQVTNERYYTQSQLERVALDLERGIKYGTNNLEKILRIRTNPSSEK